MCRLNRIRKNKTENTSLTNVVHLPLYTHVIFGVGAPTALQIIVASFPSKTVTFCGGSSIIGVDAKFSKKKSGLIKG